MLSACLIVYPLLVEKSNTLTLPLPLRNQSLRLPLSVPVYTNNLLPQRGHLALGIMGILLLQPGAAYLSWCY